MNSRGAEIILQKGVSFFWITLYDLSNAISLSIAPSCSSPSYAGQLLYLPSNTAPTTYTLYTYGFTANSSSATLTFVMSGDPGSGQNYWLLDSVALNHTNASTNVLINGGFDMGNLTGWTQFCATNPNCGAGDYGQLKTGVCYAGTYCYMDKCNPSSRFDYLIQSFTTVNGDYYIISFYLMNVGGGGGQWMSVTLT